MKQISLLRASTLACLITWGLSPAIAQEVRDLGPSLQSIPADLIQPVIAGSDVASSGGAAPNVSPYTQPAAQPGMQLGEDTQDGEAADAPARTSRVDAAISQAQVNDAPPAAKSGRAIRKPAASFEATRHGTERALFERAPVSVPLPVGVERLITLPAPAALHVPSDMDKVARLEVIDRTIYATAKVPFTPLRVIAELIDSGQQIPLDLVAGAATAGARSELEVFVVEPSRGKGNAGAGSVGTGPAAQAAAGASDAPAQDTLSAQMAEAPPSNMVQLTRYAARQLYAPKRLATPISGVQQVEVASEPLPDLFRGAHVLATPVGQWRSGQLYVTAVLVTNRSRFALEVPLEQVRGKWIAATAQHGRIGPAGTLTDTTAVYLVCERRFEACR